MKIKIGWNTFLIIVLMNCGGVESYRDDIVLEQTIGSVLKSVVSEFGIKSEVIMLHNEVYPDLAKIMSVRRADSLNILGDAVLSAALVKAINDSVNFHFKSSRYGNLYVADVNNEQDPIFNDPRLIATINLSNSVSHGGLGCYYLAINCGNHCSAGFIVLAYYANKKWINKEMKQVWNG